MIRLQTILLISVGITQAFAMGSEPNCSACEYFQGIGYVKDKYNCAIYYMCVRYGYNSDKFNSFLMCCPRKMSFDADHQTCRRDPYCKDSRDQCPNVVPHTDKPCPNSPDPSGDNTKYFTATYEKMMCPWGMVWKQDTCTCERGDDDYKPPCPKILQFLFNGTYNSYSCYNFAYGDGYGNPQLTGNMLCLFRKEYLRISYLRNYFLWNPIGKTFTLCWWFRPSEEQTSGVFSTNCFYDTEGSVLEVWLEDSYLFVQFGTETVEVGVLIPYTYWTKVCITCNRGVYKIYINGYIAKTVEIEVRNIVSQSDATFGWVRGKELFYGYFDDITFYETVLRDDEILACFNDGMTNNGTLPPPQSLSA